MDTDISGLIFDLDGTLVDSIADITVAMNKSLAEFGVLPSTPAEYRARVGNGLRVLVRETLGDDNADLEEDVVSRFLVHYGNEPFNRSVIYPGIPEALSRLTTAGIPLAICSNKPHPHTLQVAALAFPGVDFVGVLGHREGEERKPHPAAALELARAMGIGPEGICFVGDSDVDFRTARAAGMRSVLVGWGFRPLNDLRDLGPDFLLEDVPALEKFVDRVIKA